MTRKEARILVSSHPVVCGYCVHQITGIGELVRIGSNSGVYGWNWTLYLDPKTMIFFCDGYRNFPKFCKEVKMDFVRDFYFRS